MDNSIQLFEDKRIRTVWDDEKEKLYFSIVDVVSVLSESKNPQTYWRVMKKRLLDEGNETVTNCNGCKISVKNEEMFLMKFRMKYAEIYRRRFSRGDLFNSPKSANK